MMYRKRHWGGYEFEQLFLRYPVEGPTKLAAELNRSEDSVNAQAARFRLRSLTRRARQVQTRKLRAQSSAP
jgi:hypothetical protein